MANLYVVIKKSAETSTLRGLYTSAHDVVIAKIPDANIAAAVTELGVIGVDFSIYDDAAISCSGNQDGIKLPKNAFPA